MTALAPEQSSDAATHDPACPHEALPTAADEAALEPVGTSKARYLWAILLARIDEAFPLTCPHCAGEMRIIAFVTDPVSIQAILVHIGEPTRAPTPAPARDPPAWASASAIDAGQAMDLQAESAGLDPLAQPEPESIFDQRITW